MGLFSFFVRCFWLLGLALLMPVDLPAGGANFNDAQILSSETARTFIAIDSYMLKGIPDNKSRSMYKLKIGTPLHILRIWRGSKGEDWMQVQVASLGILEKASVIRRGWINV